MLIKIKKNCSLNNFTKQRIAETIDWPMFHKIAIINATTFFLLQHLYIIKSSFNKSIFYIGLSTAMFKMLIK